MRAWLDWHGRTAAATVVKSGNSAQLSIQENTNPDVRVEWECQRASGLFQ